MKRNNIFMWAYISFIIISALLRGFFEFYLWKPIVLAITVSSVFFALEDLFASLYHTSKDFLDIIDGFISEVRNKCNREKRFLEKFGETITIYENSIQTEFKDLYETLNHSYQKTNDHICSIEKKSEEKRRELNTYEKAANIVAFLGFLCLFFTLIIATSLTVTEIIQEIFTVVPFACILLARQINVILSEINGEVLNECKTILESQDQRIEEIAIIDERLDNFVIRLEESKQKEAAHAD